MGRVIDITPYLRRTLCPRHGPQPTIRGHCVICHHPAGKKPDAS